MRNKYDRGNAFSEDEDEKLDRKKTTVGGLGNSHRYMKRAHVGFDPEAELDLEDDEEMMGQDEREERRRFN